MKKPSLKWRKGKKAQQTPLSRITNETVAEHRERILAGGRRFKYPMQYARHKLVFNTIIISLVALLLIIGIGWQQLYVAQNTGTFFYRVTKVLPLPVASIDGQPVRYSDYLMNYRSSVHYLQQKEQVNLRDEQGQKQIEYIKNQALSDAVADAYAVKLANERDISISDEQIDAFIDQQRRSRDGTVSEETYDAVILDYYGWTPEEYREAMSNKLLRQEVAYHIDETAQSKRDAIATALEDNPDANFEDLAAKQGGEGVEQVTAGTSGMVPINNQDGGLAEAASQLEVGETSGAIKTTAGDGYYFVKLLETTDTQLSYAYIKVPLSEFAKRLQAAKDQDKLNPYISIPQLNAQRAPEQD